MPACSTSSPRFSGCGRTIERFGGDPKRVMVFGPSGGGMKTSFVIGVAAGEGLIHRAGVQSGPGLRFMEARRGQ